MRYLTVSFLLTLAIGCSTPNSYRRNGYRMMNETIWMLRNDRADRIHPFMEGVIKASNEHDDGDTKHCDVINRRLKCEGSYAKENN